MPLNSEWSLWNLDSEQETWKPMALKRSDIGEVCIFTLTADVTQTHASSCLSLLFTLSQLPITILQVQMFLSCLLMLKEMRTKCER